MRKDRECAPEDLLREFPDGEALMAVLENAVECELLIFKAQKDLSCDSRCSNQQCATYAAWKGCRRR